MANFSIENGFATRRSKEVRGFSVLFNTFLIIFGVIWLRFSNIALRSINEDIDVLKRCTSSAAATVDNVDIKQEWKSDDDGGGHYETYYYTDYSFKTNGGKTIRDTYKSGNVIEKGDAFDVVYNADLPDEHFTVMQKNSLPHSRKFVQISVAIGVVMIVIGALRLVYVLIKR